MHRCWLRPLYQLIPCFGGFVFSIVLLASQPSEPISWAAENGPSNGSPVTLPITLTAGASAHWEIINTGGADPNTGQADNSPGLAVRDCCALGGYFGAKPNPAYDTGLTLRLGSPSETNPFALPIVAAPGSQVLSNTQTITAGPVTMSGLTVTVEYYFAQSSATIRTLASLQNPSTSPITVQVYWASNEGVQDTERFIAASSNLDQSVTPADRWIVVGDTSEQSPVNTHVLFGPYSPVVTPTAISQIVFTDIGNRGIGVTFLVTMPPASTRRLMFFNRVHASTADALAGAPEFNANPAPGSDLTGGLSQAQLDEVVNWRYQHTVYLPTVQK